MTPTSLGVSKATGRNSLRGPLVLSLIAASICALLISYPNPAAASPDKQLFSNLKTYSLDNGLKVILYENHSAPVVALQMWVRAGSAEEKDSQAGMAHVLEHMLFKGTENLGLGEVARAVESRGGTINAFTSYDQTVFHLELPSRHLTVGIEVLADAVRHSTLDPDELRKESEVILEEFRRSRDMPSREIFKRLMETAFEVHPYRRPVIGYEETFKHFSRPDIMGFYRKWYRPDNMFLVVVGDIDVEQVRELVERHLGSWKAGEDGGLKLELPAEPKHQAFRSVVFKYTSAKAHLAVGCHIPGASDSMVHALDAFAFIAGQGQSSRLYQKVKEEQKLVYSVSAHALTPRDPGLFIVQAVLEPKNYQVALSSIMEELFRLSNEGPTEEEVDKARVNLISEFVYDQETMGGQARSLGYFESLMGDVSAAQTYLARLKTLTAGDVRRVAKDYINPSNCTVSLLVPEGEESEPEGALLEKLVYQAEDSASAGAKGYRGLVNKFTLDNGLTLIVKENHAVPTVAFRAALLGGLRYETQETNGVSNLTALLLTRGSAKHSASEMAEAVESLAGSLGGFSGRNSLGLSGEFLSEDWERGLRLLAEALLSPSFPKEEVEKVKSDALAAIAQRRDDLFHETMLLFSRTLYDGHPYSMDPLGTEASVGSLTREEILEFYRRHLSPKRLVIAVVGDVKTGAVRGLVEQLFGGLKGDETDQVELPAVKSPSEIRAVTVENPKQQAHVILGFPGVKLDSPDRYPLDVMEGILTGQGGRLFLELRDKRSLAYALTAFAQANLDPGIVAIYLGTGPDKVEDAVSGIKQELRLLLDKTVGEQELEAAKRQIIGNYELRHQTNAAQAESLALMELYGLGYQAVAEYPNKIEAVTSDDLQKAARRYLTLDRYVLAVVGPPKDSPKQTPFSGQKTKTSRQKEKP